jgi:predicted nucleic-acid-binding protein
MTGTVVIDANAILRYLLDDHIEHSQQARQIFARLRTGELRGFVPEGVIIECVYVLLKVYSVPKKEIAEKLGGLLAYRGVFADHESVLLEGLQLFHRKNVGIVDAIVHLTAEERGWSVCSFDKDLQRIR